MLRTNLHKPRLDIIVDYEKKIFKQVWSTILQISTKLYVSYKRDKHSNLSYHSFNTNNNFTSVSVMYLFVKMIFLKFCLNFFYIVFKTKWRYAYLPESGAERQKGRRQRRIAPFILTAGIDLKKRYVDEPT